MGAVPGDFDRNLFVVISGGFTKRAAVNGYRLQGRNGLGIKTIQLVEGCDALVGALMMSENNRAMTIIKSGETVCSNVDEVKRTGCGTRGVAFTESDKGDMILFVAHNEEKDELGDSGDTAANSTAETVQSGENVNNADET